MVIPWLDLLMQDICYDVLLGTEGSFAQVRVRHTASHSCLK